MKQPHVLWVRGGEASVVSMTERGIALRSTVPWPPGSRIEGAFIGQPQAAVRLKVHSCRRQPEGDFLLEGRPLDLTRAARARLDALIHAS